jgi:GTP cyclohydrolase I
MRLDAMRDIEELALSGTPEPGPRQIPESQFRRFEGYMAEIFAAFGMEMATQSTVDTPRRFVRALFEATQGYDGDPKLLTTFGAECQEADDCGFSQVIEGPIRFYALCEHHALPFHGRAFVAYIPDDRIIGISKLTRLVRLFARRFTVQERVGQQIASALDAALAPRGVAVFLEAHHLCTEMRGVREDATLTRTTVWRGAYDAVPALRAELLAACGLSR